MDYKHQPRNQQRHKRKRNPLVVFLIVLWRIISRPFKIILRLLKGDRDAKSWAKIFALLGGIAIAGGGLFAIIVIAIFSRDLPDPNKLIDRQVAQSTKIFDRTGEELLYEISGDERRTIIQLEDIPDYVPKAVIALEDKTFYEHSGFNYQRLALAVIKAATGSSGPGASTLTSQLVKNAILTPERTYTRKLKEMILTFRIEKEFDKDQILQLYLNEIPYGSTAYGVESAANLYFDKSASDITLAESALLAAIIQRPTYYSPYGNNLDSLLARKDITLDLMAEQEYITEEDRDEAKAQELAFKERREDITAPHFVFHVRETLVEKYGEHLVNQGGLNVKTTLDLEKQVLAEEVMEENRERNNANGASNAALVSLDPNSGEILAMVGSYDYFDDEIDGQVNVTTRPRQPGSSMKPLVYTLAFLKGYPPSTMIFDVVTTFPATGGPYEPKNYDLSERGPVSLRKALQGSLNIPAVKTLYLVGVESFLDFAETLGYTTLQDRSRFGLALVLGGGEVTLLEHTAAYGVLAAEGVYHEPLAILEVTGTDGSVIDSFESDGKEVLDANIARITSNVLSDNQARAYVFGTGSQLQLGGRPAAAKTGTTNDYRDAWTMGYTPSLVTGVWGGNNDFSEMNRGAGGSLVAAPIWQSFMLKALAGTKVESFSTPKIPTSDKAALSGKGFGFTQVEIDRASEKLATPLTPESYREDRLYIEAHTILHYITRSNPTGPAPSNPSATDGNYEKWESAVQGWIASRIENNEPLFDNEDESGLPEGIIVEYGLPPTEEDDLHIAENQPKIKLVSPRNKEELDRRFIETEVEVSAPRGVTRVDYFLDDVFIGTSASAPFNLSTSLKSFPNGFYKLKAVAYDDIDNTSQTTTQIEIQSTDNYVKVDWLKPGSGEEYIIGTENISLQLDIDSKESVSQITFFARHGVNEELVEAVISPSQGILETLWTPNQVGEHTIYAKVSLERSGVFTTPSIMVTVIEPPEETEEEKPVTE
jgi:penicillin-binding protein 1C